jgi:subtilisin family serine protease
MGMRLLVFILCVFSVSLISRAQYSPFFKTQLEKNPNELFPVCVKNSSKNESILRQNKITIKYKTQNWIYFNSSASLIDILSKKEGLSKMYFELSTPSVLADTAIVRHKINLVHQGIGLDTGYTGKGVIVGIVDQGIDFNHPDFKTSTGKTRVLRYWDHTISGSSNSPYGYGIVWDSTAINNGTCTSLETGTSHGTTVSGIATGNARANSKHKGAAPESDIIVVETNFNLPNWSLTIADACDYIFKVADSLGKPAVINLSLGSYLGSHDARDAAAEYIDSLITAKSGRIVVCAAGNSGGQGKYHVHHDNTSDTSFVWSVNNPGNTFVGNNKILFDLWGDTTDSYYSFAYGADRPGPQYGFVGRTNFRSALSDTNGTVVYDTIYNNLGQRIACIETWREIVGPNFHMQAVFRTIDSLNYLFRFETFGSGSYDIWAGAWQRCSDFVSQIPDSSAMPEIVNYIMPDTLQTIVSSWACSDKVITVGNIQNLTSYIDKNGNTQIISTPVIKGQLAVSSSKGPTRLGIIKPEISASGDVTFASSPLAFLNNSVNNPNIDPGGFHSKNGGTSMSAPVVAGSAALYLQKCQLANYNDFKNDLILSSTTDFQTGITPNFGYGYGKLNTQELILQKHRPVQINGPSGICVGSVGVLTFSTSMTPNTINWSNGSSSNSITTTSPGNYRVTVTDELGCKSRSPVKSLLSFSLPFVDAGPNRVVCPNDSIVLSGSGSAINYNWNNGAVNNYAFVPFSTGYYVVNGIDANGCSANDSCFIDFFTLMPIEYHETITDIGLNSLAFNVTEGIPNGGSYTGPGIIGTSFHPGLAGIGTHAIVYSVLNTNGCYSTDTSYINVYDDVGISEYDESSLVIFPNPTDGDLTIDAPSIQRVEITNLDGKILHSDQLPNSGKIDISKFSAGFYYIFIYQENKISKFKISKI